MFRHCSKNNTKGQQVCEKISTEISIREIQIKANLKYYLRSIRTPTIKREKSRVQKRRKEKKRKRESEARQSKASKGNEKKRK